MPPSAMARFARLAQARFGDRHTLPQDARAGLVLGVESVPDGLAAGVLAGVNPISGLFAYMTGTLVGGLSTSSVLMTVQATGAMAVVLSDVPQVVNPATSHDAIALLALMTGVTMVGLGAARLGSLVRFVPLAVLTGFVTAVAVNIVLGQLGNATGMDSAASNRLLRALDIAVNPMAWNAPHVVAALVTLGLIVAFERTRVGALGLVCAVVLTTAATWWWDVDVLTVGELTDVPRALPSPSLPDFGLLPSLVIPALALTFVGLVQGAAITASSRNPGGTRPDASGDFVGQGAANVAAGLFQGMPVGGSMSATALSKAAGARTAATNVIAAGVMAIVVLTCAPLIEEVAMPALAALLILVGVRTINPRRIRFVLSTGATQATVTMVTFVLTLLIPLQYAVLVGVGLAIVLHVARQSSQVTVRRWLFADLDSWPDEVDPPDSLQPDEIVVLVPYGSLFFAAAPVLRSQLPSPAGRCDGAVVVLRLRGTDTVGSTFIRVLVEYADELAQAGGRLMVVGVGPAVLQQLHATGTVRQLGADAIVPQQQRVGRATRLGVEKARAWSRDKAQS